MAAVEIDPIPGRVGQRVRNELIFDNTGGDYAAPQRYRLDIVVKEQRDRSAGADHRRRDRPGVMSSTPPTSWSTSATARSCWSARAISRAPYNRFQEIFANVRARYDAENRAASTVADSIRTSIAAYLATTA